MTPDLRDLIYATIAGVISAVLIYGGKLTFDKLAGRKTASVDRGQKITELADAMVDVSTNVVAGIRAELETATSKLTEANRQLGEANAKVQQATDELRETKTRMEERERDHEAGMSRMRRRIAQLVQVLTDNNLEVPPEAEAVPLGSELSR